MWRSVLYLLAVAGAGLAAAAPAQQLYPPLDNPKLRFENGGVATPSLPDLPGQASAWRIAQWAKAQGLNPQALRPDPSAPADPRLGHPILSVRTPDGESALAIFQGQYGYVYELKSRGGIRQPGGSSNLFLTASPLMQNATMNAETDYDVDEKIIQAQISYKTPQAKARGDVLAHVFTGFTLSLHGANGTPNYNVFLQIAQSASRKEQSGFFLCTFDPVHNNVVLGFGMTPGAGEVLPFQAAHGPLRHLHYVLNDYLCAMLAQTPHCQDGTGASRAMAFAPMARDLANWRLGGIYIGLETHDRDMRPMAQDHAVQGHVAVSVQIANLHVTRYPGKLMHCPFPDRALGAEIKH